MASDSVCIRCGEFKRNFASRCNSCGFLPTEVNDIAKSRVLSFPYAFTYGGDGDTVETGRTLNELGEIAAGIQAGRPYDFPPEEVEGVIGALAEARSTSSARVWASLAILFAAALGTLAAVVYFAFTIYRSHV